MLTDQDSELINDFYHGIVEAFGRMGVPVRPAGNHEEYNNQTGEVYLTSFFFQIGMSRFELYVNNNVSDKADRYGWRQVPLMG